MIELELKKYDILGTELGVVKVSKKENIYFTYYQRMAISPLIRNTWVYSVMILNGINKMYT